MTKQEKVMYYFAYGSNMNHKQMKERCPSSRFVKKVYLESYRFAYDGYSRKWKVPVANIIKSKEGRVWGGLFKINKDNFASLDCYEGYPDSYDRKEIGVTDEDGMAYRAITYFRNDKQKQKPSEDYRSAVIQGAKDCGLSEEYIQKYLR